MTFAAALGTASATFCFILLAMYTVQRALRNYGIKINLYYQYTLPALFITLLFLAAKAGQIIQTIGTIGCALFIIAGMLLGISMITGRKYVGHSDAEDDAQDASQNQNTRLNIQGLSLNKSGSLTFTGRHKVWIALLIFYLLLLGLYIFIMIPKPETISHRAQFYRDLSPQSINMIMQDAFDKISQAEKTSVEMPNGHFLEFYSGFSDKEMLAACAEYWSVVEKYSADKRRHFLLKVGLVWVIIPCCIVAFGWFMRRTYLTRVKSNNVQCHKLIISIGIGIAALMAIFPPWITKLDGVVRARGYAFLFTLRGYREIDVLTLFIQWSALTLFAILTLYNTKDSKITLITSFNGKNKQLFFATYLLLIPMLAYFVFSTGFLPVPNWQLLFKNNMVEDLKLWSHWSPEKRGKTTGRSLTEQSVSAHEKPAPERAAPRLVPVDYDPFASDYHNLKYGFRIQFAKGWQLKERHVDEYFTVSTTNNSGESINVVVQMLAPEFKNATLENYSQKQLNDFIQAIFEATRKEFPDTVLVNSGIRKLAKKKAVFLVTKYSAVVNSKNIYVQNIQIITIDKGKNFVVGGTSLPEKYGAFEKEFQKVAGTFSLQ